MMRLSVGFSICLTLLFAAGVGAAETDGARSGDIETVRKTCECVRKHPSGFPYIEPRITTCKVAKNGQGHVKSLDCLNCYTICSDKPAS